MKKADKIKFHQEWIKEAKQCLKNNPSDKSLQLDIEVAEKELKKLSKK